jgi:hypothetical protein
MRKSVVFHIGLPKTGTTTIQHYLAKQDENLRSLGFLYPGPQEHPAMDSHKHPLILRGMLGKGQLSKQMTEQGARAAIRRIFSDFRKSDFRSLIWSNEGIAAHGGDLDRDYLQRLLRHYDVRVVVFARYLDDWLESLYKERIRTQGGRLQGRSKLNTNPTPTPLIPLAQGSGAPDAISKRGKSALERCSEITGSLRAVREALPSAEIIVQSYDVSRKSGTVASDALAAMGLPVKSAFPQADDDAGVQNPTKSDLYSMLIYHLVIGRADYPVIRAVTTATKARERDDRQFPRLSRRRFRFMSEENILEARGYYEELRNDYPHLPVQPPYTPDTAERSLPREDGVALLEWLRPEISDDVFKAACAAYRAT